MSIMNKVLASVGIGNAKVNTKLNDSNIVSGENLFGIIEVIGGNTEQSIESIYLTIYTTYERESNDNTYTDSVAITSIKINDPFTIQKGEKKEFSFSFELPLITPVTMGKTRVWIQTGLDIKNSVNPSDKDMIEVRPNKFIQAGLSAAQNLGLKLHKVDCEESPRAYRSITKFVQEFEFIPINGPFKGNFDEIEMTFIPKSSSHLELLIQVDRKVRGLGSLFSEAVGMDESFIRINITEGDLPNLENRIRQELERYV